MNVNEPLQHDSSDDTESTDDEEDANDVLAPTNVSNVQSATIVIPYLDHTEDEIVDSTNNESSSTPLFWDEKQPEKIKTGLIRST